MVTLFQHVENLKRFSEDSEGDILQSILDNKLVMDENSLFSFYIEENSFGTWMTVTWVDGDWKTIYPWIKQKLEEYKCDKVFFVSKRWKGFRRIIKEFNVKPVGVLCEVEVI